MSPYEKEAHIQNYRDRLQDETDPKAIAFLTETLKQLTNDSHSRPLRSRRIRTINAHSAPNHGQTQANEGFTVNPEV